MCVRCKDCNLCKFCCGTYTRSIASYLVVFIGESMESEVQCWGSDYCLDVTVCCFSALFLFTLYRPPPPSSPQTGICVCVCYEVYEAHALRLEFRGFRMLLERFHRLWIRHKPHVNVCRHLSNANVQKLYNNLIIVSERRLWFLCMHSSASSW